MADDTDELLALRDAFDSMTVDARRAVERYRAAEERCVQLHRALIVYGWHMATCPQVPCDCGLNAALEAK